MSRDRPNMRRILAARARPGDASPEEIFAAARETSDPAALAGRVAADQVALALAAVVAHADAGRPAEALRHVAPLAPLLGEAAVVRLLAALENAAPALPAGTVYRDAAGRPLTFVVSYPRSGSTRFLATMDAAFPRSRHAIYLRDGRPLSLKAANPAVPGPAFVKAHELRPEFAGNPVIYLIRDGRDVVLSLNDFKLRAARAGDAAAPPGAEAALAPFLAGLAERERFGLWHEHVAAALAARAAGRPVTPLRYEDLIGPQACAAVAAALAAVGLSLAPDAFARGAAAAAAFEAKVRAARPEWSRAPIYPRESLMARWLASRGGATWRDLIGDDDKRALHEAGMTPALIAAGYETDPDWWRAP